MCFLKKIINNKLCIVFAITVFCVYLFYFIFYFHFLNYNIDEQIWAAFYIRTYDWWLNLLKLNTNCLNLIIITKHKVNITPPLKKNKKKTTNNIQTTKKNKQTNRVLYYMYYKIWHQFQRDNLKSVWWWKRWSWEYASIPNCMYLR